MKSLFLTPEHRGIPILSLFMAGPGRPVCHPKAAAVCTVHTEGCLWGLARGGGQTGGQWSLKATYAADSKNPVLGLTSRVLRRRPGPQPARPRMWAPVEHKPKPCAASVRPHREQECVPGMMGDTPESKLSVLWVRAWSLCGTGHEI
jgi:hypothetical protein